MTKILLVDDDVVDRMGVERAFAKARIGCPIHTASDGMKALDILRQSCDRSANASSYLILLDLNMPRMNGFEFLQALRQDELLRRCVIFVLTTSRDDQDLRAAYDFNVAGYVSKTDLRPDYRKLVELLQSYLAVVELP